MTTTTSVAGCGGWFTMMRRNWRLHNEAAVMDDERVYNLDPSQLRAALEVVFAERSKAVVKRADTSASLTDEESDESEREDMILETTSGAEESNDKGATVEKSDSVSTASSPTEKCDNHMTDSEHVLSRNYNFIDDDVDEEHVCAICLSGYEEGEKVISSKSCSHEFHKNCILEWLDKKDCCPCCRTDMVTSTDMNKAATAIVGKTRMCRAVATKINTRRVAQPASSNRTARPLSSTRRITFV